MASAGGVDRNPQNPVSAIGYSQVPPSNFGESYAAGIEQAGKALSAAIQGTGDIVQRNQSANDMLSALGKMKDSSGNPLIPDEDFKAVMSKSLGAKESLVGLYAGQYIANQAAARQQALQVGKGAVDINVKHNELLDAYNLGLNRGKYPVNPQQPAPKAQPAQPSAAKLPPMGPVTTIAPVPSQQPLGSGNITNPTIQPDQNTDIQIGAPLGPNEPHPTTGLVKGPDGTIGVIQGNVFRPMYRGKQ